VSLKDDFDRAYSLSQKELNGTNRKEEDEWHRTKRNYWDRSPWFVGNTDDRGEAEIDAVYVEIDRTRGSKPPPRRDDVSGQPFLVKVKERQSPEQELSVVMKPGASVTGKSYTVTVIDIERPRYVKGSATEEVSGEFDDPGKRIGSRRSRESR
jgi:hypothetical protein